MVSRIIEAPFDSRTALPFPWICSALLVDDLDCDGLLEILAATRCGKVTVFKVKTDCDIWTRSAEGMGLVTALATGDVMNDGRHMIVSISESGDCNVFRFVSTASSCVLELCLTQTLQANISAACVCDVDGDSHPELLVALTDRVVRTYRYVGENGGRLVAISKWETPAFISCLSCCSSSSSNSAQAGAMVYVSQPNGRYIVLKPRHGSGQVRREASMESDPSLSYYASSTMGLVLCSSASFVSSFYTDLQRLIFVEPNKAEMQVKLPRAPLAINTMMAPVWRLSGDQRPVEMTRMFIVGTEAGRVYLCTLKGHTVSVVEANLQTKVRIFASAIGRLNTALPRVEQCVVVVCNQNNRLLLYTMRYDKLFKLQPHEVSS
uniref:Bardet-Biedl syndrome 1 N-terminal domain-containing protein n=1 Tax=Trichuris muris TaxID=70415 RepID=A0A5S6R587_TRIMR